MSIHALHPKEDAPHMSGTTWQHRLDLARSEREVVSAVRDFLASFGPLELAALPEACRPPAKVVDGADISSYAFDLVRHECDHVEGVADLVHRLARFFSHASIRLATLRAREGEVAGDPRAESA